MNTATKLANMPADEFWQQEEAHWGYGAVDGVDDNTLIYSYRNNSALDLPTDDCPPQLYECGAEGCNAKLLVDADNRRDAIVLAGWWSVETKDEDVYFCDQHVYAGHEYADDHGTVVQTCDCPDCTG